MSKRLRQWIGFLIMVIGLGFLSSPFLQGAYQEQVQKNVVAEFLRTERDAAPLQAAPSEPVTESATEAMTEAVTETAAEPESEPVTESATEPETEAVTEPETEAVTEPETEAVTEPETEAATEPETEPETEAVTESKTEAATEPETEAVTEPATEAAIEPETEAVTEPETEAVTEPETEAITEPTTEPETEAVTEPETKPETHTQPTTDGKKNQFDFLADAKVYNASLLNGGQNAMSSLEDLEQFALDARNYGLTENVVGTLRIPRLDVELGIYLGASRDNMAKGAAVLGMTSIPLGQPDENTAIAGHRGWCGTAMFRDIQKIQMDDPIYVTTLWGELEYRVCAIEIVTPKNINWCKVHPGRSLITLMTCHPYGQNYQRYIVYAELVPQEAAQERKALERIQKARGVLSSLYIIRREDGTQEQVVVELEEIVPEVIEETVPQKEMTPKEETVSREETIPQEETQPRRRTFRARIIHPDGREEQATLELPDNNEEPLTEGVLSILHEDGELETVTAVTIPETIPTEPEEKQEAPKVTPVTIVHEDGSSESAEIDAASIVPDGSEYGTVMSNVVILAEDKMKPVAMVMAVFVLAVGCWLTVQTIRDFRRDKGEDKHESK